MSDFHPRAQVELDALTFEDPASAPPPSDRLESDSVRRAPHIPVMSEETFTLLAIGPAAVVIDTTVGAGGHAAQALARLGPSGRLFGFDRDEHALELASARLGGDPRVALCCARFSELGKALDERGVRQADGWMFDLGVSSMQLDEADRGMSFLRDGPLDLRMDPARGEETAADLVNRMREEPLANLIYELGEERASRRIARAIVEARRRQRITRTLQLAQIVKSAVPFSKADAGRIHPATRTFQALRIAVNHELEELEAGLEIALARLAPGGRVAVLSYHSLEDRIVKVRFRRAAQEGFEILTKRPLQAGDAEIAQNPRARSAKLRALLHPVSRNPRGREESGR
ncbi:MAG: 16S rRNA (cytosine(1402)-N(4))-methyltransferase RsmH [Planctomycetes bacterium]|nr:16S rRNA (cytosine(1402)-N(4))-methyltransferase RsmH [Planctomycetota bacterium]